jgi:hypothetical protein
MRYDEHLRINNQLRSDKSIIIKNNVPDLDDNINELVYEDVD